jgi:hypothetical protein
MRTEIITELIRKVHVRDAGPPLSHLIICGSLHVRNLIHLPAAVSTRGIVPESERKFVHEGVQDFKNQRLLSGDARIGMFRCGQKTGLGLG